MVEAVVDYAIFMLDRDGRVSNWNEGARRIKGYQGPEVVGQHLSIFYPDEEAGQAQQHLEQAAAEGRLELEGWRVRKNGSQFWANAIMTALRDSRGELRGFVKVTRDRTEQKEAQDALRQSEEWLFTTLRSIGDGVIATDAAGNVKFLNPVAEHLTGWRQDDAHRVHMDEVFKIANELTGQPLRSPFFKVVSTGTVVGLANHTVLIARDGTRRPIEDSGAPIFNAKGHIEGVVVVFRESRRSAG